MAISQIIQPQRRYEQKTHEGGGKKGQLTGAALGLGAAAIAAAPFTGGASLATIGGIAGAGVAGATLGGLIGEHIDPTKTTEQQTGLASGPISQVRSSAPIPAQTVAQQSQGLPQHLADSKLSPNGVEIFKAIQSLKQYEDTPATNEVYAALTTGLLKDLANQNPNLQGIQGQGLGGLTGSQPQGLGALA